jgi:hypothetical protein
MENSPFIENAPRGSLFYQEKKRREKDAEISEVYQTVFYAAEGVHGMDKKRSY